MTEGYLSADERERLDGLRSRDAFVQDVLAQVDRILASRPFARVKQRARDFLRYVVVKSLLGEAEQLKETTVAIAVFEEDADFNTAESSKVRTAASDLREHLEAYSRGEGRHDKIRIRIPLNTYVPEISDQRTSITVEPFENWHPHQEQGHLCEAIVAEIAYQLEAAGFRAVLKELSASKSRFVLRGVVEPQEETLRINVSLAAPEVNRILMSQRFEGRRDDLLKMARDVTQALKVALEVENHTPDEIGVRVKRHHALPQDPG